MHSVFPPELITLFGSSIVGGIMKLMGRAQELRHWHNQVALMAASAGAPQRRSPVQVARNKHFQWTRRCIALTSVFFIVAFPKLAAVLFPDVGVHIGYPEFESGFLFFTSAVEKIRWVKLEGLAITPLDTHLLAAIIGLYFGGSLIGGSN